MLCQSQIFLMITLIRYWCRGYQCCRRWRHSIRWGCPGIQEDRGRQCQDILRCRSITPCYLWAGDEDLFRDTTMHWQIPICIMDNTTNILHIWLNEIRSSGSRECVIAEDRQVGLYQERELNPRRNLEAFLNRVVEDAAVRAPGVVTRGWNRDPDRDQADRDPDRDHVDRNRSHIIRGLETTLDRAAAGNLQVDPSRGREQEQDRPLKRSERTTNHVADQNQAPRRVALDLDENRDPGAAPSLVTGIVTGIGATRDRLPLSKLHGRSHDPHHLNEDHAAVLGPCRSRRAVEVARGRELLPQIILTSKTRARNPKNPLQKRQQRQRKRRKKRIDRIWPFFLNVSKRNFFKYCYIEND